MLMKSSSSVECTNLSDMQRARERVSPLITSERKKDLLWLCSLCYVLGRNDAENM